MAASSSTSFVYEGESFGQKVDLSSSIRGILRNYPEGCSILLEMIQNADDARASKVSFCIDKRTSSSLNQSGESKMKIPFPALSQFLQSPALLSYNDAIFTKQDMESIQNIGDSLKKSDEGGKFKTGRFGVGFNSTYHITEVPSFLTNTSLVMFDPQAKYLPVNAGNPGKLFDFISHPEIVSQFSDLFQPFMGAFNTCQSLQKPFQGTIFRLPLRTEAQAETSKLSHQARSAEEIEKMIKEEFDSIMSECLIFLKSIQAIEIWEWNNDTPSPTILKRVSVGNATPEILQARMGLSQSIQNPLQFSPMVFDHILRITSEDLTATQSVAVTYDYLVCIQLGGTKDLMEFVVKHQHMRLHPFAGVAAKLKSSAPSQTVNGLKLGLTYCSLPLTSISSHLPIHINGFFELSTSRRNLWTGDDLSHGDAHTRSTWNEILMRDIVSQCYLRLIERSFSFLIKNKISSSLYFSIWPTKEHIDRAPVPWALAINRFFDLIVDKQVLLLHRISTSTELQPTTPKNAVIAIEPNELSQNQLQSSAQSLAALAEPIQNEKDDMSWLHTFLVASKVPIVLLPKGVYESLVARVGSTICNPVFLRGFLKANKSAVFQTDGHHIIKLLDFSVSDLPLDKPALVRELIGLPLVPVAYDMTVSTNDSKQRSSPGVFGYLEKADMANVDSKVIERLEDMGFFDKRLSATALAIARGNVDQAIDLLIANRVPLPYFTSDKDIHSILTSPDARRKLVVPTEDLPANIQTLLHNSYVYQSLNIAKMTEFDVARLISTCFPKAWTNQQHGGRTVIQNDSEEERWLKSFWKYANSHFTTLDPFENMILLLTGENFVVPLSRLSGVMALPQNQDIPSDLRNCFSKLGVLFLSKSYFGDVDQKASSISKEKGKLIKDQSAFHQDLWRFVLPYSLEGVLEVLVSILERKKKQGQEQVMIESWFENVTLEERRSLRLYFGQHLSNDLSVFERDFIARLPIYEVFSHSIAPTLTSATNSNVVSANTATIAPPIPCISIRRDFHCILSSEARVIIPGDLLPDSFVQCVLPTDPSFFTTILQLTTVSRSAVFLKHIIPFYFRKNQEVMVDQQSNKIPSASTIASKGLESNMHSVVFEKDQIVKRDKLMKIALMNLSTLIHEDARIETTLRTLRFIPGNIEQSLSNKSSIEQVLYSPNELFDPENEFLKGLMDNTRFPSFDSVISDKECLPSLRKLGLRTQLDRYAILECAKSLDHKLMLVNNKSAINEAELIKRSQLLFAYVDNNWQKLFVPSNTKSDASFNGISQSIGSSLGRNALFSNIFSFVKQGSSITESQTQSATATAASSSSSSGEVREIDEIQSTLEMLRTLNWIPVYQQIPQLDTFDVLPWSELAAPLAKPTQTRPIEDIWLCSSAQRIANTSPSFVSNSSFLAYLGWSSPPLPTVLCHQLVHLSQMFSNIQLMGENAQEQNSNAKIVVRQVVTTIYKHINDFFKDQHGEESKEEIKKMRELLMNDNCAWIWVGDRFVHSTLVATKSRFQEARPYLYCLPEEYSSVFGDLFKNFGIREDFTPGDFVDALNRMHGHTKGNPLSASELNLAVSLVQKISDYPLKAKDWSLYVPDSMGMLRTTKELVFDDAPWLGASSKQHEIIKSRNMKLVYPKISNSVAEIVGIYGLRRYIFETTGGFSGNLSTLDDGNDSLMKSGAMVEAFGQSEPITRRLRNILDLYAEGYTTLYELIQNADDAGATEVRFMLDEQKYGTSSLLSPAMTSWQGPALLAFNNAMFSEHDFQSLSQIGQASKMNKLHTTGRFGLGFASVMHFTDCPTIISGDSMVILDPHCRYLPGTTPSKPGIRIRFSGTNIKEYFEDQFAPVDKLWDCDCQHSYKGSLFRFPLRDEITAPQSEIKSTIFSPHDVLDMLKKFCDTAAHSLLFLRNVSKISVYHRNNIQSDETAAATAVELNFIEPRLLYEVNIVSPIRNKAKSPISNFLIGSNVKDSTGITLTKDAFYAKLAACPTESLPEEIVPLEIDVHDIFSEEQNPINSKLLFITSQRLSGGKAREMACQNPQMKLLPLGGTAVLLQSTTTTTLNAQKSDESRKMQGHAFCFLPLPCMTGLPVHVQGYFELSSNRRDIWHGQDMTGEGKTRSEWNINLLVDAIAPSYIHLLKYIAKKYVQTNQLSIDEYYQMWPSNPNVPYPWSVLKDALFEQTRISPLLYSSAELGWVDSSHAVISISQRKTFSEEKKASASSNAIEETAAIKQIEDENVELDALVSSPASSRDPYRIEEALITSSIPVCAVPKELYDALKKYETQEISPSFVRKVFGSSSYMTISKPGKINNKWLQDDRVSEFERILRISQLLEYCVSDLSPAQYRELNGLAMIPLKHSKIGVILAIVSEKTIPHSLNNDGFTNDAPSELIDLEQELKNYYMKHNPSKIKDVTYILTSFGKKGDRSGRELLDQALKKQYGEGLPSMTLKLVSTTKFQPNDCFYVCNKHEFELLDGGNYKLISPEALSSNLVAILSSEALHSQLNIRALNGNIISYILEQNQSNEIKLLIPKTVNNSIQAMSSKVLWNVEKANEKAIINAMPHPNWIKLFWKCMIDHDIKTIFNRLYIVPCIGNENLRYLSMLDVENKANIFIDPIEIGSLPNEVKSLMIKLGYVFIDMEYFTNDNQYGDKAEEKLFPLSKLVESGCVLQPTSKNIIHSIAQMNMEELKNKFEFISNEEKDELRKYIARERSVSTWDLVEIECLKMLPIFRVHALNSNHFPFSPIDGIFKNSEHDKMWLAPKQIDEGLLDSRFLTCSRSLSRANAITDDENMLVHLGVEEMPLDSFFKDYIFHDTQRFPHFALEDSIYFLITRDLTSMPPDFRNIIANSSIIPIRHRSTNSSNTGNSSSNILAKPCELYDPEQSDIKRVLPDRCFPDIRFSKKEALDGLRKLGLRSKVDQLAIIRCAESIQDDIEFESSISLVERARQLLKTLETYSYELEMLNDYDKFWEKICELPWFPTMKISPIKFLPWYAESCIAKSVSTENTILLPPKNVRPISMIWLCSHKYGIFDNDTNGSVGKGVFSEKISVAGLESSVSFMNASGWEKKVDSRTIAEQIIQIANSCNQKSSLFAPNHNDGSSSNESDKDPISIEELDVNMPILYNELIKSLLLPSQDQDPKQLEQVKTYKEADIRRIKSQIGKAPWIFISYHNAEQVQNADDSRNDQSLNEQSANTNSANSNANNINKKKHFIFVSSNQVAFECPDNGFPYLFPVPDVFSDRQFLKLLGIQDRFEIEELIIALKNLAQAGPPQLNQSQLHFVSTLVQMIADMLPTDNSILSGLRNDLCLPDVNGKMRSLAELSFNDAEWLLQSLKADNSISGINFVHPSIPHNVCARLGVQSVRKKITNTMTGNTNFPCPSSDRISAVLSPYDDPTDFESCIENYQYLLHETLELASVTKAQKMHIFIDENEYPSQSLLGANFSRLQGPALCIGFENSKIDLEIILGLLSTFDDLAPSNKGSASQASLASSQSSKSDDGNRNSILNQKRKGSRIMRLGQSIRKRFGRKYREENASSASVSASASSSSLNSEGPNDSLVSSNILSGCSLLACCAFQVADAFMILSDDTLYVVDPSGVAVENGMQTLTLKLGLNQDKTSQNNMFTRFPDQFKPFMYDGIDYKSLSNKTLIRIPFRKIASKMNSFVLKMKAAKSIEDKWKDMLSPILVYSESSPFSISVGSKEATVATNVQQHALRWRQIKGNRHWAQHSGLSSFFKKGSIRYEPFKTTSEVWVQIIIREDKALGFNNAFKPAIRDIAKLKEHIVYTEKWLVVSVTGGSNPRSLALNSQNEVDKFNLIPFASVAACYDTGRGNEFNTVAQGRHKGKGYIFIHSRPCDIRLPTGAPISISGGFLPSIDDYRSIIPSLPLVSPLSNARDQSPTDFSSSWNAAVMSSVLSDAYIPLLLEIRSYLKSPKHLYRFWPDNLVKESVIDQVLSSNASGSYYDRYSSHRFMEDLIQLPLFLSPPPSNDFKTLTSQCVLPTDDTPAIVHYFTTKHLSVMQVPPRVAKSLKQISTTSTYMETKFMTPAMLRTFLQRNKSEHAGWIRNAAADLSLQASVVEEFNTQDGNQRTQIITPSIVALALLEFVLSDINPDIQLNQSHPALAQIADLHLAPLSNGDITRLGRTTSPLSLLGSRSSSEMVIVATEQQQSLVPSYGKYLSALATVRLQKYIWSARFRETLGIQLFEVPFLASQIEKVLPSSWKHAPSVDLPESGLIDQGYIYRFWKEVNISDASAVSQFKDWPLIPIIPGNRLISCSRLESVVCLDAALCKTSWCEEIVKEKVQEFERRSEQLRERQHRRADIAHKIAIDDCGLNQMQNDELEIDIELEEEDIEEESVQGEDQQTEKEKKEEIQVRGNIPQLLYFYREVVNNKPDVIVISWQPVENVDIKWMREFETLFHRLRERFMEEIIDSKIKNHQGSVAIADPLWDHQELGQIFYIKTKLPVVCNIQRELESFSGVAIQIVNSIHEVAKRAAELSSDSHTDPNAPILTALIVTDEHADSSLSNQPVEFATPSELDWLYKTMATLQGPLIELSYFDDDFIQSSTTGPTVPLAWNSREVVIAQSLSHGVNYLKWSELSKANKQLLLLFLTNSNAVSQEHISNLKKLPLYEALDGGYIPLLAKNNQLGEFIERLAYTLPQHSPFERYFLYNSQTSSSSLTTSASSTSASENENGISTIFVDILANNYTNKVFLKPIHLACDTMPEAVTRISAVYTMVGINTIGLTGFYLHFVVPRISPTVRTHIPLTQEVIFSCIKLLAEKWEQATEEDRENSQLLIEKLKQTPFISNGQNHFFPFALYSPRNTILRDLFFDKDPHKFPPVEWSFETMLTFLELLGLQREINAETMVSCCLTLSTMRQQLAYQQIANREQEMNKIISIATRITKYITTPPREKPEIVAELTAPSFYRSISSIPFVPAHTPKIQSASASSSSLSSSTTLSTTGNSEKIKVEIDLKCYSECALPRDGCLVWSVMPVFLSQSVPPETSWAVLEIQRPPNLTNVINHLRNAVQDEDQIISFIEDLVPNSNILSIQDEANGLADSDVQTTQNRQTFPHFRKVFQYLDNCWTRLTSTVKNELSQMAIVPIANGSFTVRCKRLFFRLDTDLSPFLFEVPRVFGQFDQLLKNLGAKETPALQDYHIFLSELRTETKGNQLNYNELQAVLKVIRVCGSLSSINDDAGKSSQNKQIVVPFVPDSYAELVPARICIVNDDPRIAKRIDLNKIGAKFVHPMLDRELCIKKLGMRSLSSGGIIREILRQIEPSTSSDTLQTISQIQNLFKSKDFFQRIAYISLEQTLTGANQSQIGDGAKGSNPSPRMDPDSLSKIIQKLFERTTVQPCKSIHIGYVESISETSGSARDVTKSKNGYKSTMYYNEQESKLYIAVTSSELIPHAVALGISKICSLAGLYIQDSLPICVLITNSLRNSSFFMDDDDDFDFGLTSKGDGDVTDQSANIELVRGIPGVELVKVDKDLVLFRPMHPFSVGEIVAVKDKATSKLIYGKIQSMSASQTSYLASASSPSDSLSSSSSTTNHWIKRLRIIVQEYPELKIEDYLSTEVMCFKSAASSSSKREVHTIASSSIDSTDQPIYENGIGEKNGSDLVKSQANSAKMPSEVSQEEAQRALKEVMIRLGLNPSLEQNKLLEENMKLAQNLEQYRQVAQNTQQKVQSLLEENERLKSANVCKICLDKTVSKILIPCGHLVCSDCHDRLRGNQCPFDRQKITSISNFFPQ